MDPDELTNLDGETGSAAALKQLFERHASELYRFAYRYVRSVDGAKDLVQEAFLRLWRQRGKVDLAGRTTRSYLHTTVRYLALDQLRRRRMANRWRQEYLAPELLEHGALLAEGDSEDELEREEVARALKQAVHSLPPRQQQVLLMRWEQQASYNEIADALGISPKTVGVHLARGVQRLRELLAGIRY
jgi:RNA polymerase sigma-70 factor (ECF subfamily)